MNNPYRPNTIRHDAYQSILDREEAERRAVEFYGTAPKRGWITVKSLQEGPHTPSVWCAPVTDDVEPEPLPWIPAVAIWGED